MKNAKLIILIDVQLQWTWTIIIISHERGIKIIIKNLASIKRHSGRALIFFFVKILNVTYGFYQEKLDCIL